MEKSSLLLAIPSCEFKNDDGSQCALKSTKYLWDYELIGFYCDSHGLVVEQRYDAERNYEKEGGDESDKAD